MKNITKGVWKLETNRIINHLAILVDDEFNHSKNILKQKVICDFPDYRGDAFTGLEETEAQDNMKLIALAGNLSQKFNISAIEDCVNALEWAQNEIKILSKQIPLKDSSNLATKKGKEQWDRHSNGMLKIENALFKINQL